MVRPVLPAHIVDDLLPPADAEVDVDIRHGHPLGVEEPLEVQIILQGVDVGDVQAVRHHGPRRRAPARPHGDLLALGIADEVGDDEEIVHEAHLPDHGHLILELLQILRRLVRIAAGEALHAQLLEVGVPVGGALRELELRQVIGAELELHLAEVGHPLGVLHRLGPLGEEGAHLLLALHIKFFGLEPHPVRVVHRLAHLDAHEHVLGGGVLPGEVVGVVGGHQGDPRLLVEAGQTAEDRRVLWEAVVLDLQVVAVLPEERPHLQGLPLGPLVVPRPQHPGDRPGQAGGQGDEALMVLPQQVFVHPGLDVEALGEALGDHVAEVAVALLVPAQEDQVAGLCVQLVRLVEAGPGGHIDLAADDGLDALRLTGLVEVHRPVHDPVVGDGHGVLSQLLDPLDQGGDTAAAV